ncbi:tetratricopeptide repeat protein [uncultured Abyssibacter sp.]|uniref:YfgM family protein n=1 Tax=uncultured Abyssibacter sp. TaxID=2320202 RepID=UPI0032B23096
MEQRTDEEQIQRLREWVGEYWKPVVGGIVVGLAAVLGWQGWSGHQQGQALAASGMYNAVTEAIDAGDLEAAAASVDTLDSEFKGTLYAALGHLMIAKAYADGEQYDKAAESLEWVANYADDAPTRALGTARLARVRWAQGDTEAALKVLGEASPPESFEAAFFELKGDILMATDASDQAREAYTAALAAMDLNAPTRAAVDRKLAELGRPDDQAEQAS